MLGRKGAGADTAELDELTYLLESGSDRIGALDFQRSPAEYLPRTAENARVEELVESAERVEKGSAPDRPRGANGYPNMGNVCDADTCGKRLSFLEILPGSLGLRPNFHQSETRADAHMFISVVAYHLLHTIEYKLRLCGDNRTWATIRDILSTHQRLTIEYNFKEHEEIRRSHLRLCSNPEPEHQQIYQRLNLKEVPLPQKITTIK